MHIAIIGAGIAGLISLHHAIKNGFQCTVFEQNNEIGGIWVYTEKVGINEFGLPIHSSMYEGLRTNLPIQLMSFLDFPNNITSYNYTSYLDKKDVLEYLRKFADKFNLRKHIKFYNHVKSVKPILSNKWELISVNLQTKEETVHHFEAVIIGNGRRIDSHYPQLKGIETFKGKQDHSHNYRNPRPFKNQSVLIIGAGPSGLDITYHLSKTANKVFLSHHLKHNISTFYPNNVILKPDVEEVTNSAVYFKDGTKETVDFILYCTGYKLKFPFLTPECGITYENQYVQPLYKQLINIEHPTMAIIGLPYYISLFDLFDFQARFFMEYLKTPSKFPTKQKMYLDKQNDEEMRIKLGQKIHQFHQLDNLQEAYYNNLSMIAQIENIPPVHLKMYADRKFRAKTNMTFYRGDLYKIIDENNFTVKRSEKEFY